MLSGQDLVLVVQFTNGRHDQVSALDDPNDFHIPSHHHHGTRPTNVPETPKRALPGQLS